MTHTMQYGNLHFAHKMPCTREYVQCSPTQKSDALRSSARSGHLIWRLRHAVSRPCDAICALLEPSAVLCVMRCGRCCAATHPVLRRADRRRVEPTAPRMRRLSPRAGCGGCSVGGKPGRCLQDSVSTNRGTRVRHHPRPRPTARR
jgi:hypothetical protein